MRENLYLNLTAIYLVTSIWWYYLICESLIDTSIYSVKFKYYYN